MARSKEICYYSPCKFINIINNQGENLIGFKNITKYIFYYRLVSWLLVTVHLFIYNCSMCNMVCYSNRPYPCKLGYVKIAKDRNIQYGKYTLRLVNKPTTIK